jgi:hypothetical protein
MNSLVVARLELAGMAIQALEREAFVPFFVDGAGRRRLVGESDSGREPSGPILEVLFVAGRPSESGALVLCVRLDS